MDLDLAHQLEALLHALGSGLPVPRSAMERFALACRAAAPLTPQRMPASSFEALVAEALKKDDKHGLAVVWIIWEAGGPEIHANIASHAHIKRCARSTAAPVRGRARPYGPAAAALVRA